MAELKTQFFELTRMKYYQQAIWFLNGFWKEGAEPESENIWKFTQKFIELDSKKKEGNELDEFWSHKFLESLGETLTVIKLREKLRQIDLDANGKMALLEYLCFKYDKSIPAVVSSPQGENTEEVEKAQAELRAVQEALDSVLRKLEEQKRAKEEVSKKLQAQQKRLAEQKAAEMEVRKAEEEQSAAVKDLRDQEEAYNTQIDVLTKKSESGDSIVAKNKAKQELAQLKQENPLPLRRAKITAEAALRKVEKQRQFAEAATLQEHEAAVELEAAKKEVEESTRRLEVAVKETETKMQEAQDFLEEVKKKGGISFGAIWWMERELVEAKKYLPKSKQ